MCHIGKIEFFFGVGGVNVEKYIMFFGIRAEVAKIIPSENLICQSRVVEVSLLKSIVHLEAQYEVTVVSV